ncbi:MAG: septum formation protein Maf [Planctomycetes bacterium]|nr:septum formation protein Maf [Planctomycetota bacterium]
MASSTSNDQAPLILASTSPARHALLERLGLPFSLQPAGIDEAPMQAAAEDPLRLAQELALAKARAAARQHPEAWVIGGDQVLALGDELLGKPGSKPAALQQLLRLAGRKHELISATALVGPGKDQDQSEEVWVEVAHMTMAPWDQATLERYVEADDPSQCAGSYKLEERGIALFERIECADWNAIVGLPLLGLAQRLRARGYLVP